LYQYVITLSISHLNFFAMSFLVPSKKVRRVSRFLVITLPQQCLGFALIVDLVTRPLLPDKADTTVTQPNEKTRRDLGRRLQWMFDNKVLDPSLRELAKCIREDANDGAHVGNLSQQDAEDLLDFTTMLLERLVTEPKRLEQAEVRRKERRNTP
jgi:hypothetical protein